VTTITSSYRKKLELELKTKIIKINVAARCWWLTPVIIATWDDHGLRPAQGKMFVIPHLRQQPDMVACDCHHNYGGKPKIGGRTACRLAWERSKTKAPK
jgi:hypothetical protein